MKQEVGFLNRRIAWTSEGITYESDSKHVNIILGDLEMEDCKPVGAPMSPEDLKEAASVIDEHGEIDEGEYMDAESASTYRSIAARMNYLAMDRTDLQQACRSICAYMSKPLKKRCQLLKRRRLACLLTPTVTGQDAKRPGSLPVVEESLLLAIQSCEHGRAFNPLMHSVKAKLSYMRSFALAVTPSTCLA